MQLNHDTNCAVNYSMQKACVVYTCVGSGIMSHTHSMHLHTENSNEGHQN